TRFSRDWSSDVCSSDLNLCALRLIKQPFLSLSGGVLATMSWFHSIIPPKIKRKENGEKKAVPQGLWSKCAACEAVLYYTDLVKNLNVCPKCGHHNRIAARERLELLLDPADRKEVAADVTPLDPLKFKDGKRYTERLTQASGSTNETDALIV